MIVPPRSMPLGLGLGLTGGGNAMGSPFYGLSFDGGDYIAQTSTDLNTYTTGCMEAWEFYQLSQAHEGDP